MIPLGKGPAWIPAGAVVESCTGLELLPKPRPLHQAAPLVIFRPEDVAVSPCDEPTIDRAMRGSELT